MSKSISLHKPKQKTNWVPFVAVALAFYVFAAASGWPKPLAIFNNSAPASSSNTITEGTLKVVHSDNFATKKSSQNFVLETTSGKRYDLRFNSNPPKTKPGSKIRVKGAISGSSITVGSSLNANQYAVVSGAQDTTNLGQKKIAVILFNFSNDTRQPFTPATVTNNVFTSSQSLAAYYNEQTFGKTTVTGEVMGWYTIGQTNANCDQNYGSWSSSARSAAESAGKDLSSYTHFIYIWPSLACGFAGVADLPGNRAWMNGTFSLHNLAHEFGHNLGAQHASSQGNEYGDPFDVMGEPQGSNKYHMNNFHKGQLGWWEPSHTTLINSIGNYDLYPNELSANSPTALRIPVSFDSTAGPMYYYIEYRVPFGFDNFANSDPVVNGVSIRSASGYDRNSSILVPSTLIDTTLATPTLWDAPLLNGQTWNDAAKGIQIKVGGISGSNANVEILAAGNDRTAPSTPTDIKTSKTQTTVTIKWSASADTSGVGGYEVYRNGSRVGVTSGTSFHDTGLTKSTPYNYTLIAYDNYGNASIPATFTSTTPALLCIPTDLICL